MRTFSTLQFPIWIRLPIPQGMKAVVFWFEYGIKRRIELVWVQDSIERIFVILDKSHELLDDIVLISVGHLWQTVP